MRIAFIIPAYNEEGAIGKTIIEAKRIVPQSLIYVCDNNSTDKTSKEARENGAIVIKEFRKGKGNAVRRLFTDVDADIYIMVDGDNTYSLKHLKDALNYFVKHNMDHMIGDRFFNKTNLVMKKSHKAGNLIFTFLISCLCGIKTADVFSGFRIMSKRFVNSFPLISSYFEIESEISIFASKLKVKSSSFPTSLKPRKGTKSKLNTFVDGFKILIFIFKLIHREYPLKIYLPLSFLLIFLSSYQIINIFLEYLDSGLVIRQPTFVGACFGFISGLFSLGIGVILKEIVNNKYENRYLSYISCKRNFENDNF